jgi:hypothetical protein
MELAITLFTALCLGVGFASTPKNHAFSSARCIGYLFVLGEQPQWPHNGQRPETQQQRNDCGPSDVPDGDQVEGNQYCQE